MLSILPIFLLINEAMKQEQRRSAETDVRKAYLYSLIIIFTTGLLLESLAVLSNLNLPPSEREQFVPDPLLDILVSIGYYLPLAIIYSAYLVKIRTDTSTAFISGGIYGVITEQEGTILLSLNPLLWLYVFLVYGSYLALAQVLAEKYLVSLERKEMSTLLNITLLTVILLISFITIIPISMLIMLIVLGLPL